MRRQTALLLLSGVLLLSSGFALAASAPDEAGTPPVNPPSAPAPLYDGVTVFVGAHVLPMDSQRILRYHTVV